MVIIFMIMTVFVELEKAIAFSSSDSSHHDDSNNGFGSTVKKIGMVVGLDTLISVTLVLSNASLV